MTELHVKGQCRKEEDGPGDSQIKMETSQTKNHGIQQKQF